MQKNLILKIFFFTIVCLFTVSLINAQEDKLEYSLTQIDIESSDEIIISFGAKSAPLKESIEKEGNWLVRKIDIDGNEKDCYPSAKKVILPNITGIYAQLNGCPVDTTKQKVLVRFLQANFPEIITTQPKKKENNFFAKSKDKDDSDFYFSGFVRATKGGKPTYTVETKVSYLQDIGEYGEIGVKGTADIAEDSNFDPDSIKLTGSYQKVVAFKKFLGSGVVFNSDFFGGEFDRKNKTRNIATGLDLIWYFPSKRWKDKFATIDFTSGIEGGHNLKHKLDTDGFGNYGRLKLGSMFYFVDLKPIFFQRVDFTAGYTARLLNKAEPFTEDGVDSLTKKTRHYGTADLDLMFSKYLGFSIKYRYGSLPPAFKFVDSSVSFGLTFKAKQAK